MFVLIVNSLLLPNLISFQEKIMHFPTWVDLKGRDSVPETVHHVVKSICHHFFLFNFSQTMP